MKIATHKLNRINGDKEHIFPSSLNESSVGFVLNSDEFCYVNKIDGISVVFIGNEKDIKKIKSNFKQIKSAIIGEEFAGLKAEIVDDNNIPKTNPVETPTQEVDLEVKTEEKAPVEQNNSFEEDIPNQEDVPVEEDNSFVEIEQNEEESNSDEVVAEEEAEAEVESSTTEVIHLGTTVEDSTREEEVEFDVAMQKNSVEDEEEESEEIESQEEEFVTSDEMDLLLSENEIDSESEKIKIFILGGQYQEEVENYPERFAGLNEKVYEIEEFAELATIAAMYKKAKVVESFELETTSEEDALMINELIKKSKRVYKLSIIEESNSLRFGTKEKRAEAEVQVKQMPVPHEFSSDVILVHIADNENIFDLPIGYYIVEVKE